MTATQIGAIALASGALGVLLFGMIALLRANAATRAERALVDALDRRMATLEAAKERTPPDGDVPAKPDVRLGPAHRTYSRSSVGGWCSLA